MIMDKIKFSKGLMSGGFLFAFMGVGNALGYIASHLMEKKNFDNHFLYQGNGRLFTPFKSLFASDKLMNVAWTSPTLIFGGMFLQRQLGAMKCT
jgi:hypothetical protein